MKFQVPSSKFQVPRFVFQGRIAVALFALLALLLQFQMFAAPEGGQDDVPALRPPRAELPPTFWEQHGVQIILGTCLLLAVIGLIVWLALRPRPPVVVPPEILARQDLEKLRGSPETGEVLSRVSQILRRYAAAAFNLPPGELTTTEFCRAADADEKIGSELSQALGEFLRRCDARKFSPAAVSGSAEIGAVAGALSLVEKAEVRRAELRQNVPPA
jgi:hypothetical protein